MGAQHIRLLVALLALSGVSCAAGAPEGPAPGAVVAGGAGTVQRPSYNTGNGFYVRDGKLYDAKGHEFRIRGVNRLHWDSGSADGLVKSGSNTVRWDIDFTRPAAVNTAMVTLQSIDNGIVPIVGNWTATCNSDPSKLAAIVSTWVAQAPDWTKLDKYLILNVANEWGPANSAVWRDSYVHAIAGLRAAGYTAPILIDSGGCGQDDADLLKYSQAVFESDPQRNVIFASHLYGGANDYSAAIQSVRKGNPTVITLAGNSPTHPFAPNYNGSNNSYSGLTAYHVDDAQGMTQLNGDHTALQNVGGVPGAWTVTLSVDSTHWDDFTGGGKLVDSGNYAFRIAQLAALSRRTGAAFIIGEFGPGKNIGPSPTRVTPGQIITAADANGIGWLAWAWDDNNLANCSSDDRWFSMTTRCGHYTQPSDLTSFGKDVVLDPGYGIAALAKRASIFSR